MIDIWISMIVYFENVTFLNNTGWDNLVNVFSSICSFTDCQWSNILTYSANIIYIIDSNFTLNNSHIKLFYPQFLYASFSKFILFNNSFSESINKNGTFKVGAIFLQNNMSFSIIKNNFSYLNNFAFGSV